ncbi:MAG: MBL fold metallo-hydrolase [Bacilli bacterium]|nr:MBL fold metallo-hydrolase [Bacilli bacterium]
MEIKFIGNGAGFSKTNNNAFFEYNNELILIDCSMLNMNRIKEIIDFKKYDKINVFITHMHADHVSGVPNLIQHLFHSYDILCNIMIPSSLKEDLINLNTICGVGKEMYHLIVLDDNTKLPYLVKTIRTPHAKHLVNGCYGYVFKINNKICVFTGDTKDLSSFKDYIDNCDEAYIDTSYNSVNVHISWNYLKNNLPKCKKIYLMHIDDEEGLKKEIMDYSNVEIVKIYER